MIKKWLQGGILLAGMLCLAGGCAFPPASLPAATPAAAAGTATALSLSTALPPTAQTTPSPTPTSAFTPTESPCTQNGTFEDLEADLSDPEASIQARVYLPPCYDTGRKTGYPVLYLLHGQTYDQNQWIDLGAAETADRLIRPGEIPPFLIVFPYESQWNFGPEKSTFGAVLADGLVPAVDERYHTCVERGCRAIGGLSRGGNWAIHLGFERWEVFGVIGAHSAPIFYGDLEKLAGWLALIPQGLLPRVMIDAGRKDPELQYMAAFEKELTRLNVPHEWYMFNGYHEAAYWSAHLEFYLKWYSESWADAR